MSDGFLGRWARRKQAVQQGLPVDEPTLAIAARPEPVAPESSAITPPAPEQDAHPDQAPALLADPAQGAELPDAPPPVGMDDVQLLTRQSDYTPFLARNVAPEVRNAAMKKLFTDPHFNQIDWLDVYMDDYSIPNPLPLTMMKKMASAKFLKLVEDDPPDPANPALQAQTAERVLEPQPLQTPPQVASESTPEVSEDSPSDQPATTPALNKEDHDHSDLRLQQDHAAGPQGPGEGTG